MQDIQNQCDEIIGNDNMDKDTALGVIRVQHAMETLLLQQEHDKESEITNLQHEINILKLDKKSSSTFDQNSEIMNIINDIKESMKKIVEEIIDWKSECNNIQEEMKEFQSCISKEIGTHVNDINNNLKNVSDSCAKNNDAFTQSLQQVVTQITAKKK